MILFNLLYVFIYFLYVYNDDVMKKMQYITVITGKLDATICKFLMNVSFELVEICNKI